MYLIFLIISVFISIFFIIVTSIAFASILAKEKIERLKLQASIEALKHHIILKDKIGRNNE